jgi:murein tripeptide amidase MpaA
MGGLNIYELTLTSKHEKEIVVKRGGKPEKKKKQCIYIQARQHAAETHGSIVMAAIIKELTSKPKEFEAMLEDNVVKIVPMINPDGVIIGNARSSISGVDLNR